MKISIFYGKSPCSSMKVNGHFGKKYFTAKTSIDFYGTAWRYMEGERILRP
jgi:hypothetical protein